jgi:hypothetical protein
MLGVLGSTASGNFKKSAATKRAQRGPSRRAVVLLSTTGRRGGMLRLMAISVEVIGFEKGAGNGRA